MSKIYPCALFAWLHNVETNKQINNKTPIYPCWNNKMAAGVFMQNRTMWRNRRHSHTLKTTPVQECRAELGTFCLTALGLASVSSRPEEGKVGRVLPSAALMDGQRGSSPVEYLVSREILDEARLDEVGQKRTCSTKPSLGKRAKESLR